MKKLFYFSFIFLTLALILLQVPLNNSKATNDTIRLKKLYQPNVNPLYSQELTPKRKQIYDLIDNYFQSDMAQISASGNAFNFVIEVPLGGLVDKDITSPLSVFLLEHKELFMFQGNFHASYAYTNSKTKITYKIAYFDKYKNIDALLVDYNLYLEQFTKLLVPLAHVNSDYMKIRYVHDYLIMHNQYNELALKPYEEQSLDTKLAHSPISALLAKYSPVCEGYAELFSICMNALNIKQVYVTGQVTTPGQPPENHAWNLVYANNKVYQIDLTFDDPVFATPMENRVSYQYFLTPQNHVPTAPREIIGDNPDVMNSVLAMASQATSYYWGNQTYNSNITLKAKAEPLSSYSLTDKPIGNVYHSPNLAKFDFLLVNIATGTITPLNYDAPFNVAKGKYLLMVEPKNTGVAYLDYPLWYFSIFGFTVKYHKKPLFNPPQALKPIIDINGVALTFNDNILGLDENKPLSESLLPILSIAFNGYRLKRVYYTNTPGNYILADLNKSAVGNNFSATTKLYFCYEPIKITFGEHTSNFLTLFFNKSQINFTNKLWLAYKAGDIVITQDNYEEIILTDDIALNACLISDKARLFDKTKLTTDELSWLGDNGTPLSNLFTYLDDKLYFSNEANFNTFTLPYQNIVMHKKTTSILLADKRGLSFLEIPFLFQESALTIKINDQATKEYFKMPLWEEVIFFISNQKVFIKELIAQDNYKQTIPFDSDNLAQIKEINVSTFNQQEGLPQALIKKKKALFSLNFTDKGIEIIHSPRVQLNDALFKDYLIGYTITINTINKVLVVKNEKYNITTKIPYTEKDRYNIRVLAKRGAIIIGIVFGVIIVLAVSITLIKKSKRGAI